MAYPQTGKEVFVSFSMSNTMLTGIGKGTITREDVSADYLKDLFQKYGVIVSAKPEQRRLLERVNEIYDLGLELGMEFCPENQWVNLYYDGEYHFHHPTGTPGPDGGHRALQLYG